MNRFEYYSKVQEYQENHIEHHGIIGQKWGQRRWQNADGTFNEEGKVRYFGEPRHKSKKLINEAKEDLKKEINRMNDLKEGNPDYFEKYHGDGFKDIAKAFMRTDYARKFIDPIFKDYFDKTKEINSKINDMPEDKDEWRTAAVLNALVDKTKDNIFDLYNYYDFGRYEDGYITDDTVRILRNDPSLFDEYKSSKNKFDKELNKVIKDFTKDMNDEDKQKFIDNIIDVENTNKGIYYRDNYPTTSSPNTDIYGAPMNPKRFDKLEDMKNNLNKAEEICSRIKDIQTELYPGYSEKEYRYGYDMETAVLSTLKKLNLSDKKYDEITEKDWNNVIKESEKKFAENKKESDIKDRIYDKKNDIYLGLENTFGEMIWYFNNWDYTKEAKKNLGYDKIEDKDLTDTQWNNIKKEIMENTGKAKYQEYLKDMKRMYG